MGMFSNRNLPPVLQGATVEILRPCATAAGADVSSVADRDLVDFLINAINTEPKFEKLLSDAIDVYVKTGSKAGGNGKPPATQTVAQQPATNVAPLAAPAKTTVTFPRRNTDAGRAPYSITSDTYEPRSAHYHESAGHIPEP